jgi:hypothetical protein
MPAASPLFTVKDRFDDVNERKSGSSFYNNLICFVRMLNQRLEVRVAVLQQLYFFTHDSGLCQPPHDA